MLETITDVERLQRINQALMNRVESQLDQQGNSFALFQTALNLEGQVKRRTDELTNTMHRLEKINDELAAAKEAAEIANQSKTSFLAAASHDVLQPLNAALLSVSVLADLQTTQEGRRLVGQVERSLENMNALLGTLLDISRLEAGVLQPVVEAISLDAVFDSLEPDFLPVAERKRLVLRFGKTGLWVKSDRTMLRRILQNLVSNALRYTSSGEVVIYGQEEGRAVVITVLDTGRGITHEQQSNIFEEFNRGDAAGEPVNDSGAGFGLGLSIVRRMVAALDHKLEMNSKLKVGTEFRLSVLASVATPSRKGDQRKIRKTALADLSGTKILLLENDPAVLEAMTTLLSSWNCEVVVATNAQESIDALGDTDWLPELIIADQHLNQGDLGTAALEDIWSYTGKRIPALVASADPTETLEAMTQKLGLELLVKPVKPATLRALITHLIST